MGKLDVYLDETIRCVEGLKSNRYNIFTVANIIKNSKQIFICGNGGSAATASHFANDLHKQCRLRAYCLSDNTPVFTAWSNDINYGIGFMKQIGVLSDKGDTLIVISGSGNSPNIIHAVNHAKRKGLNVIAFLGEDGGRVKEIEGINTIHIKTDMLHSEDWHSVLCHLLTYLIKEEAWK